MPKKKQTKIPEKNELHPRNRHRSRYDFPQLIKSCRELAPFVFRNRYDDESIDFTDPDAVKTLNRALLKHFYGITHWDIPANYLCPPIPGRADYIHLMADLLRSSNKGVAPPGKSILVYDIGVGANCIYPILGNREYGWQFVGSDVDPVAIRSAKRIVELNSPLAGAVEIRLQKSPSDIFRGVIQPGEVFDLSICNPPFHSSLAEAGEGTRRKWKNLGKNSARPATLIFGGQYTELCCNGGEEGFVRRMIEQSAQIPESGFWFSTLVSKSSRLGDVQAMLKRVKAVQVKTIPMSQGQKVGRMVAWTFLTPDQRKEWRLQRWGWSRNE